MDKEDTRCTRCGKLISEQPEIINNKFNANQTAERRVEYEYDNDYEKYMDLHNYYPMLKYIEKKILVRHYKELSLINYS